MLVWVWVCVGCVCVCVGVHVQQKCKVKTTQVHLSCTVQTITTMDLSDKHVFCKEAKITSAMLFEEYMKSTT